MDMPFDDIETIECRVPMRDGVWLSADLHRPVAAAGRRLPVLLQRTPYDRRGVSMSEISAADPRPRTRSDVARKFARAGYAVLVQDCRGRHGSEGSFTKYVNEAEDGFDTLAWIRAQPWGNGRIGTFGLSYEAHAQLAAATLAPAGLACMLIDSGGFADAFHAGIRQGGAFELKQLTWAYKHARLSPLTDADPERAAMLQAEAIGPWMHRWPWSEGNSPLVAAPEFEAYVLEQWRNADYGPYWQQNGLSAAGRYGDVADVPTMLMCSWYDPYASTALANYAGLRAAGGSDIELVMGPWTHGRRSEPYAGEVDFGPAATLDGNLAADYDELRLAWFERWLNPVGATPPPPRVRYFRMGGGDGSRGPDGRFQHGGTWSSAPDWPPPDSLQTSLYLHGDGGLRAEAQSVAEAALAYDYDPSHPVPTIGGAIASGAPLMDAGAFDQVTRPGMFAAEPPYGPLADRPDVLVFQTEPLAAAVDLVGTPSARLFVSSDRTDTDITVKLVDVHPDGFAMNLAHGILRLRYRSSWEQPSLLQPGQVYEIEVPLFPTANRFQAGHRIRVDISSSNFPHFDPNPNTGGAQGIDTGRLVARNRVHLDAGHPSRIVLPVQSSRGKT